MSRTCPSRVRESASKATSRRRRLIRRELAFQRASLPLSRITESAALWPRASVRQHHPRLPEDGRRGSCGRAVAKANPDVFSSRRLGPRKCKSPRELASRQFGAALEGRDRSEVVGARTGPCEELHDPTCSNLGCRAPRRSTWWAEERLRYRSWRRIAFEILRRPVGGDRGVRNRLACR